MEETLSQNRIRTRKQQNALEVYCKQLADTLNEAGISQKMLMEGLEIDHSGESIKSLFRTMGRAKYGKDSTAKLTTKELMDIYEEFNRHTAKIGIHVPFPSEDERNFNETYK